MLANRSPSPSLLELNARSHRQKFLCPKEYFSSPRRIEDQNKGLQATKVGSPSTEVGPQKRVPPFGRKVQGTVSPAMVLILPLAYLFELTFFLSNTVFSGPTSIYLGPKVPPPTFWELESPKLKIG